MTTPLTRAEAFCWVAYMLGREADAHFYAWPPTERDNAVGGELQDAANAFMDEAVRLNVGHEELWKRSLAKWDAGYQEAQR